MKLSQQAFLSDIFINDVVEPVKNHVKAKDGYVLQIKIIMIN